MQSSKHAPDIVVMERHTGRLVTGAHAPNAANLVAWLTKHPSFEVLRPGQQTGHVSSTSSFYGKQKSKHMTSKYSSLWVWCGYLPQVFVIRVQEHTIHTCSVGHQICIIQPSNYQIDKYQVLSSPQNTNYAYKGIRIQLRMYIHTSVNLSMWVDCHSDAHFYTKYSCCIDISITPIFAFNVLADDKSPHRKSSTNTEQEPVQSKKPSGPDSATIRSNVRKSLIEVLKECFFKPTSNNTLVITIKLAIIVMPCYVFSMKQQ